MKKWIVGIIVMVLCVSAGLAQAQDLSSGKNNVFRVVPEIVEEGLQTSDKGLQDFEEINTDWKKISEQQIRYAQAIADAETQAEKEKMTKIAKEALLNGSKKLKTNLSVFTKGIIDSQTKFLVYCVQLGDAQLDIKERLDRAETEIEDQNRVFETKQKEFLNVSKELKNCPATDPRKLKLTAEKRKIRKEMKDGWLQVSLALYKQGKTINNIPKMDACIAAATSWADHLSTIEGIAMELEYNMEFSILTLKDDTDEFDDKFPRAPAGDIDALVANFNLMKTSADILLKIEQEPVDGNKPDVPITRPDKDKYSSYSFADQIATFKERKTAILKKQEDNKEDSSDSKQKD